MFDMIGGHCLESLDFGIFAAKAARVVAPRESVVLAYSQMDTLPVW
jgi:hypothetical protein